MSNEYRLFLDDITTKLCSSHSQFHSGGVIVRRNLTIDIHCSLHLFSGPKPGSDPVKTLLTITVKQKAKTVFLRISPQALYMADMADMRDTWPPHVGTP